MYTKTKKKKVVNNCSDQGLLEPLDKFKTEKFFVIVNVLWSN